VKIGVIGRISACLCAFILGFITLAAALHLLPISGLRLYAEERSEKLALLDQWAGRSTVAAFGSSHMHLGFDPRVFDSALRDFSAQKCLTIKTINLAVKGGSQTEQRAMALEYLKSARQYPDRLCMILLELNAGANFGPSHLVHPRSINIYDPATVRFANALSDKSLSLKEQVGRKAAAWIEGFFYFANVGMIANAIFQPPLKQDILLNNSEDDRRGFGPEPSSVSDLAGVAGFLSQHRNERYQTHAESLPEGISLLPQDLVSDPRAPKGTTLNPQVFYLVVPLITNAAQASIYPSTVSTSGGPVPVINLARPDLYPQLFRQEEWRDPSHLSELGAHTLSSLVADQVKAWLTTHPLATECGGTHAIR
jgi:hypothetical protein